MRPLKPKERQAIGEWLSKERKNGSVGYGSLKQATILFHVSKSTVQRIWNQTQLCLANSTALNMSTKLAGRVGRKLVQIDINQVKATPAARRANIRSLASALDMAPTTIYRRIKEGATRVHTNAIKPYLTEQNKQSCMVEVLKDNGGNNYKIPHMKKDSLEREENLPVQVSYEIDIVDQVVAPLQS